MSHQTPPCAQISSPLVNNYNIGAVELRLCKSQCQSMPAKLDWSEMNNMHIDVHWCTLMYIAHICTSCSKLTIYTSIVISLGVLDFLSIKKRTSWGRDLFSMSMLRTRSNCYKLRPSIVVHGWRPGHILWCLACQFFPQQQVPGGCGWDKSPHEVHEQVYGIFQQRFWDMKKFQRRHCFWRLSMSKAAHI